MRSNLEAPKSVRAAALGIAVATGAMALASAQIAQAEEPAVIESGDVNLGLEGRIEHGVLVGTLDFGGWFTGTTITVRKPLAGIIPLEKLAELEGKEFSANVEGEILGGIFTGRLTTDTPLSFAIPLTFPCTGLVSGFGGASHTRTAAPRRTTRPATAARVTPEPGGPTSSPLKFVKPLDPRTFFPEKPEGGKSMGPGNPRGFDIAPTSPYKFTVTGPAQIQLHLYPWVFVDEAKRKGSGPLQVSVTLDETDKREVPPQPLASGKIFKETKFDPGSGDIALWTSPLVLPPLDIPAGSHEVVITSGGHSFRVMLVGAQETSKPDTEVAIEKPFEEDPTTPPNFRFPCRLDLSDESPGLELRPIAQSPVPLKLDGATDGLAVAIRRFHDDTLATVTLSSGTKGKPDYVEYRLERPLEQVIDHMCEFERVEPPARSTDSGGPTELPLLLNADGTVATPTTPAGPYKPGTVECRARKIAKSVPERTIVECWEQVLAARVRAHRTVLDNRPTNPAGKPRRHVLRHF